MKETGRNSFLVEGANDRLITEKSNSFAFIFIYSRVINGNSCVVILEKRYLYISSWKVFARKFIFITNYILILYRGNATI